MVPALSRGFSDANGSWKIICTRLRKARSAGPFASATSSPSTRMAPAVGVIRRKISLPTVDLPQPDFADEAERLAAPHGEAHPVHRLSGSRRQLERAAAHLEMLGEAVHLQKRRGRRARSAGARRAAHLWAAKQATPWRGALRREPGFPCGSGRRRAGSAARRRSRRSVRERGDEAGDFREPRHLRARSAALRHRPSRPRV